MPFLFFYSNSYEYMKFDIITIFPDIFDSYLKESLINRAIKKKLINFKVHDLRKWSSDKRKTIDDRPFGGGPGMILKISPVLKAIIELKKKKEKSKVIVFTPRGKKFNQKVAYDFSKLDRLIMISGRYEGVDERILKYVADEKISIGDYILMGGELPAMIVIETVSRFIPGVVGKDNFLLQKTNRNKNKIEGFSEYPQYSRPEVFNFNELINEKFLKKYGDIKIKNKKIKDLLKSKWRVPRELLSGDHQKIDGYRKRNTKLIWK